MHSLFPPVASACTCFSDYFRIAGYAPTTAKAAVIPDAVKDLQLFLALSATAGMLVQTMGLVTGHDFSRAEKPQKTYGL
jgi:hypothetical protein